MNLRKNKPMQDKFQFYVNELGPELADRAKANGRSLTQEIRERLRESLRAEGVDVDKLNRDWARGREAVLVLAFDYREAANWAERNRCDAWDFVRDVSALDGVSGRDYVIVGRFAKRSDAEQIMNVIRNADNVEPLDMDRELE